MILLWLFSLEKCCRLLHTKMLLYNYYFWQCCCGNLWGRDCNGVFIQFTVTLYESCKLFSCRSKQETCKGGGVGAHSHALYTPHEELQSALSTTVKVGFSPPSYQP